MDPVGKQQSKKYTHCNEVVRSKEEISEISVEIAVKSTVIVLFSYQRLQIEEEKHTFSCAQRLIKFINTALKLTKNVFR